MAATRPGLLQRLVAYAPPFLLAVAVVYGFSRLRTDGLADRLAADAQALPGLEGNRTPHALPPLPGAFGEQARGPLLALISAEGASMDTELCRAIRQGELPVSALSPGCREQVQRAAPAVEGLLAATHAERAGPPEGLGPLDDPTLPLVGRGFSAAGFGAKVAALQMRMELAEARPDAALQRCLDLLALARDLPYGTGLPGRLTSVFIVETAFLGCGAALDAAPAASQSRALETLARIWEGWAPFSETTGAWSVVHLLEDFGPYLGHRLAGLPTGARAQAAARRQGHALSPVESFQLKDFWHTEQRRMDDLEEAARQPAREERIARVTQLSRPRPHRLNPLSRQGFEELPRLVQAAERARAQLRLLALGLEVDLARRRQGRWPELASLPSVLGERADAPGTALEVKGAAAWLVDRSAPRGEVALWLQGPAAQPGPGR